MSTERMTAMSIAVMFGGNGYIGRNTTKVWMKRDPEAVFYVVSRSGKNQLQDKRIINIKADVTSAEDVRAKLPEHVDYFVNFVGCAAVPKGSTKTLEELNLEPAKVCRELAESYHAKAMGAIGGKLGSRAFTASKKAMLDYLRESSIPTEAVEPTLVIGDGRKDSLTRMVPLLKFLGSFNRNFRPVQVEEGAEELTAKMLRHEGEKNR